MRVFVVGTGRCGTVSFAAACQHATNYVVGHETTTLTFEFPDNTIEVSSQLRHCVWELVEKYPHARWVHLIREEEACVASLARLDRGDIMTQYIKLFGSLLPSRDLTDAARLYYRSTNGLIRHQLRGVSHVRKRTMRLETIQSEWPEFWKWIGARGDYAASLASWNMPHNTSAERGDL